MRIQSNLLLSLQAYFYFSSSFVQVQAQSSSSSSSVAATTAACKSTPNDSSWPSLSQWNSLNESLSGRLIKPLPPASSCHFSPSSSNTTSISNSTACTSLTTSWSSFTFHQNNPISTAWNNMNNDSCLPSPSAPCTGQGYPVYVVNASTAEHVKLGVDFARINNLRVGVKASGHDYLKRSSSPNSLSIWTRYMTGNYTFHSTFQPSGCNTSVNINTTAVTAGAGSYVSDIYQQLNLHNLTVVDGMGPEVTMGGYLTGGGHSPISHLYGLGADQVYEVEMVLPSGEIVVANECQNSELFWAVRGGGGATYGILTKVTIRTIPSPQIATYSFTLQASANSSAYWDIVSYFVSQYPTLSAANISAYTYLYPNITLSASDGPVASFEVVFALPGASSNSSTLQELWNPIWSHINSTYPGEFTAQGSAEVFPDLYTMFQEYADDSGAGVDKVVGSWLLPSETLANETMRDALITFTGTAGARLYMVSGKGVWDAMPRGGGNAVNPAWRKALVHAVTSQSWTPLDSTQQASVEYSINHVQTEALRQLVPSSGAYLNEAYWNEPNFQKAFWGENYQRLLKVKRDVDPDDLFWCRTCVGSEGWEGVGDGLCRVG